MDSVTGKSATSSFEDEKFLEETTALFDMKKCLDCLESAENVVEKTSTIYEPDDQSLAGRLPSLKARHIEEWSRDITSGPAETTEEITRKAAQEPDGSSTLEHTVYDSDSESSSDTEPDTAYSVREVIDHVIGELEKDILQETSTGDYRKAEKSQLELMQLLKKREERFKIPLNNEAQLLETLAEIYYKQQKYHEANAIYKRLLKDEEVESERKWSLCHSLSLNYQREGRLKEAAKYAEKAWDGRKRSLDAGDAERTASVALLICIYEQKGQFRLAAALKNLYLPAIEAVKEIEHVAPVNESIPVTDHLEEWLLTHKFDPLNIEKMNDSGTTPLTLAISSRQDDIVKNLLHKGVDVESKCANGLTPLACAVNTGTEVTVSLLLDKGALVDSMSRGMTPLHEAVKLGDLRMVKILLSHNANVNMKARRDQLNPRSVSLGQVAPASPTPHDVECIWTPLFRAVDSGREDIVQLLIEEGAIVDARGPSELTALMLAVKDQHDSVTKVLLEKGSDTAATDESGWTALHQAAHIPGREIAASLLLEHGAAVNATCDFGQSPLHIATEQRNEPMIRLLVSKYNANLELQDSVSRTPLHLAIEDTRLGRSAVVTLLLELGADINAKNDKDQDALAAARQLQASSIVRIIKQWKHGLGKIVTEDSLPISKLITSSGESESSKTSRSRWSFHRNKNS